MKYEGIDFNETWVLRQTEEQFIQKQQHQWHGSTEEQRDQKLREAYQLIQLIHEDKQ